MGGRDGVWEGGARGFGCHFMRGAEVGRMSLPRFEPVRTKKSFIFLVVAGGKVRIGSATLLPSEESVQARINFPCPSFPRHALARRGGSCLPCFLCPFGGASLLRVPTLFYLSALVFAALPDTPRNGVRNEINTWATF